MQLAKDILKKYWNYNEFKGLQEDIINAVINKNDVLALMPTGGGKSFCFQVPALMNEGVCLVISPLIALMKDQVQNLQKKNIPAVAIYSGMCFKDVEQVLLNASQNQYKFLYVSPERLESKIFKAYLESLQINLIAVDEAHCISQWGYDFRPAYLKIAKLRETFQKIPIIALTASATEIVQKDIVEKLQLNQVKIFQQLFDKTNLSYSVFKVDSKINKVIEVLKNVYGSSIVYCKSRKLTNYVAQLLTLQNISADFYHAGLSQEERNKKQENWIQNKTRVIVCTNAFGMGIDKPDVRTVIHYDTPDCLENYYQEAGRAGRDGKKAYAVLLYHITDIDDLKCLPTLRFPDVVEIRKVYQSIADYLQIPVGIGEGSYYDFDLIPFSKNFNLDILLVLNVLKTLEHEGHITLTENIFIPAKIQFIADRYFIESFEKTHPYLETIIKCLLRTYSGILDNLVSINEKQIAKICRLPYDKIYLLLAELKKYNLIDYLPQKETPQIYFILNRASANSISINHDAYYKRKQQFVLRVNTMIDYVTVFKQCRSQFISNYFNSTNLNNCGVCDNCIAKKQINLSEEEFKKIQQELIKNIPINGVDCKELITKFKLVKKEKLWDVINFLQDEKMITIDSSGNILLSTNN